MNAAETSRLPAFPDVRLSIVIPLFNKAATIGRAIESVLAQTITDFELVIVDDGSTDDSLARCHQFTDSRIRLFSQPNQGVSVARNQGVALSQGDIICFLDADDCYNPDFLNNIKFLVNLRPDAALYCCRFQTITAEGQLLCFQSGFPSGFAGVLDDFFQSFRRNRGLICSSCFAMRRPFFEQLGGFVPGIRVGEDLLLWLRAALLGPVMYSDALGATVYQDAPNRTPERQPGEMAGHIRFFLCSNDWQQGVSPSRVKGLEQFIYANTVQTALGALSYGQPELAGQYADLLQRHARWQATLLKIACLLPARFWQSVRSLRNALTTR